MTTTGEILQTEYDKIQTQIKNVDETISSQERTMLLNESYSKRMSAYTRATMTAVFGLAIAVFLNMLKSKFSIIPDTVITFSYIILFSGVLIYAMFILSDVNSRETTDFDKLELNPPSDVSKAIRNSSLTQKERELGNLDLLPGFCIGKDCCSSAMAWDENSQKCVSGCLTAGNYIDTTDQTCKKCGAGKYSAVGDSICSTCAAGTYSAVGAGTCTKCAAGTYSAAGAETCTHCPADKPDSPEGSTSVSACTAK